MAVVGISYAIARQVSSRIETTGEFQFADQFEEITVEGDYPLKGYFQDNQAKTTFIFVNGLAYDLTRNQKIAYYYQEFGDEVNYLIFDLRAHGMSGGERQTFGREERYDINRMIDFLIERDEDSFILLVGDGSGGTVAVQAAGIDNRINGLILDDPISDLVSHAALNINSFAPVPSFPFSYTVPMAMGLIGGFPPESIDITVGDGPEVPVLIMASKTNKVIDYRNSERIYEAIKSDDESNKLVVDESEDFVKEHTDQYFKTVREFIAVVEDNI